MTRYTDYELDDLDPARRAVADKIVGGPRGSFRGPFKILIENPGLADAVQSLGAYLRFESAPADAVRELVILTVSRHWNCGYEWISHLPIGLKAGLSAEVAEAIRKGAEPDFDDPDLAAAYALATELLETKQLTGPTFETAVERLGKSAVLDLAATVGYYGLMAAAMNAFEMALPPDAEDPFA